MFGWGKNQTTEVKTAPVKQSLNTEGLRAAFSVHEANELPIAVEFAKEHGIPTGWLASERWKNYQKYAQEGPHTYEIVGVRIGQTQDTHEMTVTLTAADGRRVTLWCVGSAVSGSTVRSITSY